MHLLSLAVLLENGGVLFSLGPIVRSIVEHCARVAWALDHRIKTRDRLARCVWIRLDDRQQSRRLAKAHDSQADLKIYTEMLKDLRRDTIPRMFFESEIKYNKNNELMSIRGQHLPGFSEMTEYLAAIYPPSDWRPRAMYDYLSAQTHPTMQTVRTRTRNYVDQLADANEPVEMTRLQLDDISEPRDLTYLATACFINVWRLMIWYYGLDSDELPIALLQARVNALRT